MQSCKRVGKTAGFHEQRHASGSLEILDDETQILEICQPHVIDAFEMMKPVLLLGHKSKQQCLVAGQAPQYKDADLNDIFGKGSNNID